MKVVSAKPSNPEFSGSYTELKRLLELEVEGAEMLLYHSDSSRLLTT